MRESQGTQIILENIEDDLHPNIVGPVASVIRRVRNAELKSPAARFFDEYKDASEARRDAMFRTWKTRYLRRGDSTASENKMKRRFGQYLSFGKKGPARAARRAGEETNSVRLGAIRTIQELLGRDPAQNTPEYLWVTVYVTRLEPISVRAKAFREANDKAKLMTPMVYIGHRRDSKQVRDRVRISDATRRNTSKNGLTELTKLYLDQGFVHKNDFEFVEDWTVEVLGEVDHGHGLEASNAMQASIVEDLKRIEIIELFLEGAGPRPLNSKIDNSLLGVTNIRGILREHSTEPEALDIPAITRKLNRAKGILERKYEAYRRKFIRDEDGARVLPLQGVTKDGIGQVRTAEFGQQRRANILRAMEVIP